MGTGQVRGRQWDSRECYNKSLELAEEGKELPQIIEVEKMSKSLMEINIDLCLQELVDVQVDPNKPSRIIQIGKRLNKELAQ